MSLVPLVLLVAGCSAELGPSVEDHPQGAPVPSAPALPIEPTVAPPPPYALDTNVWYAGGSHDGKRWFAGTEAPLGPRLAGMGFAELGHSRARALQVNLVEWRDGMWHLVLDHTMPMNYGTCFSCQEMNVRLTHASVERLVFDAVWDTALKLCSALGRATAGDTSLVVLEDNGVAELCGRRVQLTPGISAYSRWRALEREAAGPVPPGFRGCLVISPRCRLGDYEVVCQRPSGGYVKMPGGEPTDIGLCTDNPAFPFFHD